MSIIKSKIVNVRRYNTCNTRVNWNHFLWNLNCRKLKESPEVLFLDSRDYTPISIHQWETWIGIIDQLKIMELLFMQMITISKLTVHTIEYLLLHAIVELLILVWLEWAINDQSLQCLLESVVTENMLRFNLKSSSSYLITNNNAF